MELNDELWVEAFGLYQPPYKAHYKGANCTPQVRLLAVSVEVVEVDCYLLVQSLRRGAPTLTQEEVQRILDSQTQKIQTAISFLESEIARLQNPETEGSQLDADSNHVLGMCCVKLTKTKDKLKGLRK